ncbi:MAG TPA: acyl-CoA dehydrogenase family protein, partial [Chloroflexia bacterium]|nr:acyl-CoA dehydrogenase family protein [Chloroflexia bacterium]
AQAPEVEMVVQTVRDYVSKTLLPQEMAIEHAGQVPDAIRREMGDLGFYGLPFGDENGGFGLGFMGYTLAMEQLGRANAALAVAVSASSGLAGETIALGGSAEQRARWLPTLASGEVLGAWGLVEEGSTADGRGLRTTATPTTDGDYRLDGNKTAVLNGPDAGLYVVFARLAGDAADGGTGIFVVPRDTPGLTLGPAQQELGLHGLGVCEVRLAGCVVPADGRLAGALPVHDDPGLALAEQVLLRHGITLGAIAIGGAARLLDASLEFATQRKQFGQPVGAFGAVQHMLADSATELFAAQQAVYRAATGVEQGRQEPGVAAQAKLFATEAAFRIADRAMQVHGGMGFMKELWIERGYRDARVLRLLGIPGEALRTRIAAALGCPVP